MTRKRVAIITASYVGFLVLITWSLLVNVSVIKAQTPVSQTEIGVAATTPLLISYQGRLSNVSGPITATVSMTFTFWDAASGGNVQWQEANKLVSVNNGFFTTLLGDSTTIAPTIFDGRNLWLGVQVESDAEMSPRQRIASVPYAFTANTLVSGAVISGTESGQSVLTVQNTSSANHSVGMWSQVDTDPGSDPYNDWAMGVAGFASSTSGHTFGVWGGNVSTSPYSIGVLGNSLATSGEVYGVQGIIHSTTTNAAAVSGSVDASSGQTYAVYGNNPSVTNGAAGVFGLSSAASGETYGVLGRSNSPNGWAGYFDGPVRITGKLTVDGATDPLIGEYFKVDTSLSYEFGDILIIDPTSDTYKLSDSPNDTRIAGVVWEDTMPNEQGEIMVIFMGAETPTKKMYVKADASYGPIQRGDLLTTSSTPGHAMRAEPVDVGGVKIYRPGTILGKALEPLGEGKALIRVFVTLQ